MSALDIPPAPAPSRNSDQKFCHACARVLHVSASVCPACAAHQPVAGLGIASPPVQGTHLETVAMARTRSDQKYCHGCGQLVHTSAPACPKCGARQLGMGAPAAVAGIGSVTLKSRVTGALLAFFLGGFGAHKFYCGKVGLGFLYLVFCWTWIPSLVALVEGIVYLTSASSDEEFTQKFCI